MKGLSIEQKAKAYDKALGKAEDALNDGTISNNTIAYLQDIFPELKESEDEKIRKTLIRFHKSTIDVDGIKGEDIIAWLENLNLIKANSPQLGEQKPFDYEDANIQQKDFAPKSAMEATKEKKIDNANKVEPKFHEGDWIIRSAKNFKHNTYIIKEIKDYYVCEDLKGRRVTFTFSDVHKNFKSWGISDAKDGDVLCCESGWTCIFKTLNSDNISFSSYCFMDNTGWFCETGSESHTLEKAFIKAYNGEIYPATKEQRDLLFAKMKEAGYIFDFKNKELKKIGNEIEIPFGAKDSELQEAIYNIPKGFHAEIDDDKIIIKKGEKFVAWSEKDNMVIEETLYFLREYQLSDRCKDESDMQNSVTCIDWLKSLKDRYTWKPSEEQMEAVKRASNGSRAIAGKDYLIMESLYNDLEKLTE